MAREGQPRSTKGLVTQNGYGRNWQHDLYWRDDGVDAGTDAG